MDFLNIVSDELYNFQNIIRNILRNRKLFFLIRTSLLFGVFMSIVSNELKYIAKITCRDLRQNATNSENIMWNLLRNRKMCNRKFYRQHPMFYDFDGFQKFFVADFYCHEIKLVIEIDGGYHKRQIDYDLMRTEIINLLGIEVIRFTNEEVENNLNDTIKTLKTKLNHQ